MQMELTTDLYEEFSNLDAFETKSEDDALHVDTCKYSKPTIYENGVAAKSLSYMDALLKNPIQFEDLEYAGRRILNEAKDKDYQKTKYIVSVGEKPHQKYLDANGFFKNGTQLNVRWAVYLCDGQLHSKSDESGEILVVGSVSLKQRLLLIDAVDQLRSFNVREISWIKIGSSCEKATHSALSNPYPINQCLWVCLLVCYILDIPRTTANAVGRKAKKTGSCSFANRYETALKRKEEGVSRYERHRPKAALASFALCTISLSSCEASKLTETEEEKRLQLLKEVALYRLKCFLQMQCYEEMLKEAKSYVADFSNESKFHYFYGIALSYNHYITDAIQSLQKCLQLDSTNTEVKQQLELLVKKKRDQLKKFNGFSFYKGMFDSSKSMKVEEMEKLKQKQERKRQRRLEEQ